MAVLNGIFLENACSFTYGISQSKSWFCLLRAFIVGNPLAICKGAFGITQIPVAQRESCYKDLKHEILNNANADAYPSNSYL